MQRLPDSARAGEPRAFSVAGEDVYRSERGSEAPRPVLVIDFGSLSPGASLGPAARIGGVELTAQGSPASLDVVRAGAGAGLRIPSSGLRIALPKPGVPTELTGWFHDVTVTAFARDREVRRYEFPGPLRLARCRVAQRGVTDLEVTGAGDSLLVEVSLGDRKDGEHA